METIGPRAGDQLERTLERYARVRLDPNPAQARRARAAVMEEARLRLANPAGPAGPAVDAVAAASARRGLFAGWSTRRLAASLIAAVLAGLLVGSSAFAASRPGGTLYDVRVTLEVLTLPADPGARLDAEIAQAQSRLADVVDASARVDQGALDAALGAYEASVGRLEDFTGAPAARALEAIRIHRSILVSVRAAAPAAAAAGIDRALVASDTAIGRLLSATGASGEPPGNPGANGGAAGDGGGNGDRGGNGGGSAAGGNGGGSAAGGNGAGSAPGANGNGSAPGATGNGSAPGANGNGNAVGNGGGSAAGGSPGPAQGANPDPSHKPDHSPKPAQGPGPHRSPAPDHSQRPADRPPRP